MQGIANNYPGALPNEERACPVNQVESISTPEPVKDAIEVMCKKLTHALYFREVGKILTPKHQFLSSACETQNVECQGLISYLTSLLPNKTVGTRKNIEEYGDRFKYNSGYKLQEDFFIFMAQVGHGIILWGIVCGPGTKKPSGGPLNSAPWLKGACGPGVTS